MSWTQDKSYRFTTHETEDNFLFAVGAPTFGCARAEYARAIGPAGSAGFQAGTLAEAIRPAGGLVRLLDPIYAVESHPDECAMGLYVAGACFPVARAPDATRIDQRHAAGAVGVGVYGHP